MRLIVEAFVREGGWQWKPGFFRSRVMTRIWWGPLAIGLLHISIKEFAESEFDWRDND